MQYFNRQIFIEDAEEERAAADLAYAEHLEEIKKLPPPHVTIKIEEGDIPLNSARDHHLLFEETKK